MSHENIFKVYRMSNRVTRGQVNAQNIETRVLGVYKKHGARLVESHGSLATRTQTKNVATIVPDDTVVILMVKPGECMYSGAGRLIADEFFKSNTGLRSFFKGGGGTKWHHVANSQSRTFLAGQKIPSIFLTFKDATYPSLGYVWKLPMTRSKTVSLDNMLHEPAPARSEIYTGVTHGNSYLLSSVLRILGPGVYIVTACLPPGNINNNRLTGVSAPRKNWGGSQPAARSKERTRYGPYTKPLRPPRPGSVSARTTTLPGPNSRRIANPHQLGGISVHNFLNAMSKNPKLNFNALTEKLRANVNINRLRRVRNILINPQKFYNTLTPNNKAVYMYSRNKAHFIHNRL